MKRFELRQMIREELLKEAEEKLWHVFYWEDPNRGWGVGETLAIVKAGSQEEASKKVIGKEYSMGVGVIEISRAEAQKIKKNIQQQIRGLQKSLKNIKI